jgi:hypothetical protein
MAILLLAACASGGTRWQPSLVSQVPDSTWVRFHDAVGQTSASGFALDWQRGRPRVIVDRDTLLIPEASALEARLKEKRGHAIFGTITGWALGAAISYATCAPPKKYCGEEDPTPLLGTLLGAWVGSRVKTDWWVRVQWDTPSPHGER